jgi:hypothetical protein
LGTALRLSQPRCEKIMTFAFSFHYFLANARGLVVHGVDRLRGAKVSMHAAIFG